MTFRPWMKVASGVFALIVVLLFSNAVINAQKDRELQAQVQTSPSNPSGFGPKELYQSETLLGGLMESISPPSHSRVARKSLKLELADADGNPQAQAVRPESNPLKLIRTGQITIEVPEFDRAAKDLGNMVAALGGYIAETQIHRNPSGTRSGSISLRVPAGSFESVGSKIRALGKVQSESSNVQDVTKAYSDLETRLRVKREALNRIRELLRTNAGNLKEVLEAEKESSRITEEIEQAEGERRFYDHQVSLSTITVELNEPEPISLARPSSWWALSESLRDAAAMVAGSLAFLLRLMFILLPWAAAGWVGRAIVRWVRRRQGPRPQASSASTTSASDLPKGPEA